MMQKFIFLLFLAVAAPAIAQHLPELRYYFDTVSGDDANTGKSVSKAVETSAQADALAAAYVIDFPEPALPRPPIFELYKESVQTGEVWRAADVYGTHTWVPCIFVSHSTGDNGDSGLTPTLAKVDYVEAQTTVAEGGTIFFMDGTQAGLTCTKSNICFRSIEPGNFIVNGKIVISGEDADPDAINVIFSGLFITNGANNQNALHDVFGAGHKILNCIYRDCVSNTSQPKAVFFMGVATGDESISTDNPAWVVGTKFFNYGYSGSAQGSNAIKFGESGGSYPTGVHGYFVRNSFHGGGYDQGEMIAISLIAPGVATHNVMNVGTDGYEIKGGDHSHLYRNLINRFSGGEQYSFRGGTNHVIESCMAINGVSHRPFATWVGGTNAVKNCIVWNYTRGSLETMAFELRNNSTADIDDCSFLGVMNYSFDAKDTVTNSTITVDDSVFDDCVKIYKFGASDVISITGTGNIMDDTSDNPPSGSLGTETVGVYNFADVGLFGFDTITLSGKGAPWPLPLSAATFP